MDLELYFALDLIVLGLAALISIYLGLRHSRNLLFFLLVPAIVLTAIHSYYSANSLRGLSRPDYMPDIEVSVLALAPEKGIWLHIWYYDSDLDQPRAIKVPLTEENKKKAIAILERLSKGQEAIIGFKEKESGGMGPKVKEIIIYDFSTKFNSRKNQRM